MKIFKEIGRNPNIDWIIVLAASLIIVLSLGYSGYTLYNAVTNGSIQGNGEQAASSFTKPNEKTISSAIEKFDDKADATKKAKAGYSGFPDPSK